MAITVLTHAGAAGSGVATTAKDTTGASTIVLVCEGDGTITPSDSKGNTWQALTAYSGSGVLSQIFYCHNPATSTAHTFQVSATYGAVSMIALAGTDTTQAPDINTGANGAGSTTVAVASHTPSVAGEIVITGSVGYYGASSTPAGFTVTDGQPLDGGVNYGNDAAYQIQTAATAVAPSWTWDTAALAASMASFKAAGSGVALSPSAGAATSATCTVTTPAPLTPTASAKAAATANATAPALLSPSAQAATTASCVLVIPVIQLVAHTSAGSSTGTGVTTPAINTNGATLLVVTIASGGGAVPTLTDSAGNTWQPGYNYGNEPNGQMFYTTGSGSTPPATSAAHTFTVSGGGNYQSICVQAWKGTLVGQTADINEAAPSNQPGSATPAYPNELIVTGVSRNDTGTETISPGTFQITDQVPDAAGACYGSAIAYQIQQGAASAVNPNWAQAYGTAQMLSFQPAPIALTPTAQAATSATAGVTAPAALTPTASAKSAAASAVVVPVALPSATSTATTAATAKVTAAAILTPTAASMTTATATATAKAVLTPSAQTATQATANVQASGVAFLTPTAQAKTSATGAVSAPAKLTPTASANTAASATVAIPVVLTPSAAAATAAVGTVQTPAGISPSATATTAASVAISVPAHVLSSAGFFAAAKA